MDAPFPLGFPLPTAWYLVLYVVTLVIHVGFMNYVLAGTAWLAVGRILGSGDEERLALRAILQDWMPFFLSAAITAGVAPLLFIQILYKQSFYTANLLLFHRWMAILPVLIVGFYLLYLLKSKTVAKRSYALRAAVGLSAFLCFGFVAYSWTENHLLSVKGTEAWGEFYGRQRLYHFEAALLPRLGIWFIGSLPTMFVMVLWQLWFYQTRRRAPGSGWSEDVVRDQTRAAALGALLGLLGAGISAVVYAVVAREAVMGGAWSWMAGPYAGLAGAGIVIQVVFWWRMSRSGELTARSLMGISAGVLLTVLGMTVVREAIRLSSLDITTLYDLHADAAQVGGLFVFLFFFVVNALLAAWVFRLVAQGWKPEA